MRAKDWLFVVGLGVMGGGISALGSKLLIQPAHESRAQDDARRMQVCKARCPHGGEVDRTWQSGGESSVYVCTCHETFEQHFVY